MALSGTDWDEGRMLRIVGDEPRIASHEDALFLPGRGHGVFDRNGRLVVEATDFDARGRPAGGRWSIDPAAVEAASAAEIVHVHAGRLGIGLAAFLTATLPRFWSRATAHGDQALLLVHGGTEAIDRAFDDPQTLALLASFGISRGDCVSYDRPVRIRSLVAPAPAFEAACLVAHDAHRRTLATITARLAGPDRATPDATPLHLSAALSRHSGADEEQALDAALRREGVRVVDPSTVSMPDLLGALRHAPVLSATAVPGAPGPALLAFARAGTPTFLLCPDSAVDVAAARLAAVLSGHRGGILEPLGPGAAAALLGAIRHAAAAASLDGAPLSAGWSDPGSGDPRAVLGRCLSGRARMRTGHGQRPWWQVDLERVVRLVRVRIHAPLDGPDRSGTVRLLASLDGHDWIVLAVRDDPAPIGNGIGDSAPHDFDLPPGTETRHLRIQRMEAGTLALDQVEIVAG